MVNSNLLMTYNPDITGLSSFKAVCVWLIGVALGVTTGLAQAAAAPIVWGSASPSRVVANEGTVKISYGSLRAEYCSYGGARYPTRGSGVFGPYPPGTHSVTFTCTGPGGTTSKTISWTAYVPAPAPPVTRVSVSPRSIYVGETATLSWTSTNATRCDRGGPSGSVTVGPWTTPGFRAVRVTCYGPGGSDAGASFLFVKNHPKPAITVTLSKAVIKANAETLAVRYTTTHADYCSYEGTRYPVSGNTELGPFAPGSHTLTFTCTGAGGTTSKTLSWQALLPPVVDVSVSKSKVTANNKDTLTLSWDSPQADACRYDGRDYGNTDSLTLWALSRQGIIRPR